MIGSITARGSDRLKRVAAYVRRAVRGLSILQELGRSGLFRIENQVSIARLDYEPADIYLRMDSRHAPSRIRSCAKEPWTVEWLERWVRAGDVLYDIGANVGAYSLVAASQREGSVQVIAVEPAYATFSSLCDNIVLNELGDLVTPLNIVLGSKTTLSHLNYRDLEAGAGLHSTGECPLPQGYAPMYRQPVLTCSLDDLLSQYSLPSPNHLKIDVDGDELNVLRGALGTLDASSLRTLMIEVNESDSGEITDLLVECGFELQSRYHPPSSVGYWYGLFTSAGGSL